MNGLVKALLLAAFTLLGAVNAHAQCQNYRVLSRLGVVEDCLSGGVSAGQILTLNGAGQVVPIAPGATTGIFGIATASGGSGSTVIVLVGDGNVPVSVDNSCTIGNFVIPSTSIAGDGHCATSPVGAGQIVGTATSAASSPSSIKVQISAVSSPAPGGSGGDTVFTPLLSNAVIQSITSDGTSFTLTCNITNCGLTPGTSYNLGMGLPIGCADTSGNVSSVSGFTATLANRGSCTANASSTPPAPYANQIGQISPVFLWQSKASTPGLQYGSLTVTADGHTSINVYNGGTSSNPTLISRFDMQADGKGGFGSAAKGIGTWIGGDGLWCIGPFSNLSGTTCNTTGWDLTGKLIVSRGAPTPPGTNGMITSAGFFNSGPTTLSSFGNPSYQGANAQVLVTATTPAYYRITPMVYCLTGSPGSNIQLRLWHWDLLLGTAMSDDYLSNTCITNSTVVRPTPIIVPQGTGAGQNTIEVYVNVNAGSPTYQVVVYVEAL